MAAPAINDIVSQVAESYGVPPWIALDIMQVESGGNPSAVGDQGTSFGLFQLHKGGGQGDGYPLSVLLDPVRNTEIAMSPIARAYRQGVQQGLTGYSLLEYTASHSGHPTETGYMPESYRQQLIQAYQSGLGAAGGPGGIVYMPLSSPTAAPPAPQGDPIEALDSALQFQSIGLGTVFNFGSWFVHNFEAFVLRVALILLGLLLVVFGLVKLVGTENILQTAKIAAK